MLGQLLAIAAAVGLTYFLLRLRQSIGGHSRDKRWPHRAYIVNLEEADWSRNGDFDMQVWPKELEIRTAPSPSQQSAVVGSQAKPSDEAPFARRTSGHTVVPVFLLLMLVPSASSSAQSTIFNIPTTDVVAKKKTYFEFDFISHLESTNNGGFQTYVPRVVFGVGKNIEVGANVAATHSAAPAIVYLQPNIKWQFYANEKAGTALSAGAIAYTPLKERSANDSFGFLYANGSKKFSGDHGARLTVGGYGLVNYDVPLGPNGKKPTKGGAMVGYEQPLSKKVSFVADWFSSNNGFGYVTPGFSFALPKNGLFNVGYSIGNTGKKNNGLFVYYGITF